MSFIIHAPTTTVRDGRCRYATTIVADGVSTELFFMVDAQHAAGVSSPNSDSFVVACLVPAMQRRTPIEVQGAISERLYYNLTNYVQPLLARLVPGLASVEIRANRLSSERVGNSSGVGTGFSAGIDSLCALADHFFAGVPPSFKITHLAFNNVGSHGSGGHALFMERLTRLQPAAAELGLPLIAVDSNLDGFIPGAFQQTNTLRNVSAILALQGIFAKYVVASSFKYEDCRIEPNYDDAFFDPVLLPLLSTESTTFISSGCQYTRVEKTRRVADLELARKYLDVCVDPNAHGNCSVCFKCLRTLFTLELLGKKQEFAGRFDLAKFEAKRTKYIADLLLANDDPFAKEIRDYMLGHGMAVPVATRILAAAKKVRRPIRRCLQVVAPRADA